jgi:hypothetical protein
MVTFHQGGTMMDGPSTPPALRTPAQGVWRHTTDNTYAFRFKFFTFDAQNVFTGWVIIAGETTVDVTGNANSGPATVQVYAPNGVLVATVCAETVGTRDSSSDRLGGFSGPLAAQRGLFWGAFRSPLWQRFELIA